MKELIEEYIIDNYMFSSNIDGWCIFDKHSQQNILLTRLIRDIERIFPDINSNYVCTHWWAKNVNIITDKINTHMCTYHLRMGNGPKVWEVVNSFGKPFDIKTLRNVLPIHLKESAIYKAYDEWFDEKVLEATKIQMGIK